MRLVRHLVVTGMLGAVLAVAATQEVGAQATCPGNNVIDVAPYTCVATRVITGITFTVTLNVDATGRAVVDYVMDPVQQADVPIGVDSYTDISSDPRQFITGVIPAGQTTAQLVVPRIECGQLDMKAVFVTPPGQPEGRIAGPMVTWGDVCQVAPTTTAAAPTSAAPATVSPTIPATGAGGVVPWMWAVPAFAVAAVLMLISRRRAAAG